MDIVTAADRPDLEEAANAVVNESWPEFVFHDAVASAYGGRAGQYFARYRVLVLDGDAVVAGAWGVPFAWDGTLTDLPDGYDGALVRAVEGHEAGEQPTTLSFMAAAVARAHSRRGLALTVLEDLTARARSDGLARVVAPLRPTLKHRYPTFPMAQYATWTRPDGLSIDPWVRTHQRMGARVLGTARRSMVVEGTVAQWEGWADMVFPVSGDYVVPGALDLLHVDRERDRGTYVEDNLWVEHRAP